MLFFSLENEVMHVDWRKIAKESDPPHHNIIMRNVEDFTHTVPSKLWQKQLAPKSTYTMMMMMTSTE